MSGTGMKMKYPSVVSHSTTEIKCNILGSHLPTSPTLIPPRIYQYHELYLYPSDLYIILYTHVIMNMYVV